MTAPTAPAQAAYLTIEALFQAPLIRLNLEAYDQEEMPRRRDDASPVAAAGRMRTGGT